MASWFKKWLGWEEIDAAAVHLAEVFAKHVDVKRAGNSKLIERAFSYVVAQAKGEKRSRQWAGSKIARLSNSFGWALAERGFEERLSMTLARELAMRLAQESGAEGRKSDPDPGS